MKHIKLTQQELADISEAIELPETKQRFRRKLLAVKMVAVKMVAANIARKKRPARFSASLRLRSVLT
tara:strand:+ start:62 stop:262 length:201 start_codon:yes stop_codon:yes gene_type:complete